MEDIAKALNVPTGYFFDEDDSSKKIIQNGNHNNTMVGNGNNNDNANKDLEVCLKENEMLREQVKDKEKLIKLLEGNKD